MSDTQERSQTIKIVKINGVRGYILYVGKDQKYFTELGESMDCSKLTGDEEIEDTGETATLTWWDTL